MKNTARNLQITESNGGGSGPNALVCVEGASKKFCRDLKRSLWYGVCDIASEFRVPVSFTQPGRATAFDSQAGANGLSVGSAGTILRPEEFWAVDDVSFTLDRGECLGLIGHNGAGKTTVLRMINGLIKPDLGRITLRGRVGALIALGAGFSPVLTGRENIFINGAVLGFSRAELKRRFDEIIEFSGLGDFIDAPVQSYSSGMVVRLGFAIASSLEPDILLVDEVLAVGDTSFKVRCYNRIRDLLPSTAVVLVSHYLFDIARIATKVCVLTHGRVAYMGDPEEGIALYASQSVEEQGDLVIHRDEAIGEVTVPEFEVTSRESTSDLSFSIQVESEAELGAARLRLVFFDETDRPIAEWDSLFHSRRYQLAKGLNRLDAEIKGIRLTSGSYRVAVVITDENNVGYYVGIESGLVAIIQTRRSAGAPYKL